MSFLQRDPPLSGVPLDQGSPPQPPRGTDPGGGRARFAVRRGHARVSGGFTSRGLAASIGLLGLLIVSTWVLAPGLPSGPNVLEQVAIDHGMLASWTAARELALTVQDPTGLFGYNAADLAALASSAPVTASYPVTLGITLIPNDPRGLHDYAIAVSTPGNPMEGHFLTSAEYDQRFAPSAQEETHVEQVLASQGFRVVGSYPDRTFLEVRGTAAGAEALFGTTLVQGDLYGQSVVLPASAPTLPTSLAPDLLSVSGLSQNAVRFSLASLSARPLGALPQGGPCITSCNTIFPDWTHFMYGLDQLYNASGPSQPHWAQGTSIGILLWAGAAGGFSPSDIQTFAQGMYPGNQPLFSYNAWPLGGTGQPSSAAPSDPSNAPMELTLDMEWSVSQAPGANLQVVYVPEGSSSNGYSPQPADLENGSAFMLTRPGLDVFTQSFGAPETDQSFQAAMDLDYQKAATLGISVFAASGDNGGSTGSIGSCTSTPQVEYPASSPYVTAVGGTAPILNSTIGGGPATNQGVANEPAWHGSGGGYSQAYGLPSWQRSGSAYQTISSGPDPTSRGVPDIAGPAANDTFFYNGTIQDGEGTSFASPFWAGLIDEMAAIRANPLGFLNPRLYALGAAEDQGITPAPFRWVTQGQTPGLAANCIYYAQAGWDPVTGYGVPRNAFDLYASLVASYINVTISFSPDHAAPGSSVTIHVLAMNGSAPLAGGTLSVSVWSLPQTLRKTSLLQTQSVGLDASGSGQDSYAISLFYPYGQLLVVAQIFNRHDVGSAASVLVVSLLGSSYDLLEPMLQPPVSYAFFALIMGLAIALGWVLGLRTPRANPLPIYRRFLPARWRGRPPSAGPSRSYPPQGASASASARPYPGSTVGRPAVAPSARGGRPPSGPARAAGAAQGTTRGAAPVRPPPLGGRPATAKSFRPSTTSAAPTPTAASRASPGTSSHVAPGVTMVVPPARAKETPQETSKTSTLPPPSSSGEPIATPAIREPTPEASPSVPPPQATTASAPVGPAEVTSPTSGVGSSQPSTHEALPQEAGAATEAPAPSSLPAAAAAEEVAAPNEEASAPPPQAVSPEPPGQVEEPGEAPSAPEPSISGPIAEAQEAPAEVPPETPLATEQFGQGDAPTPSEVRVPAEPPEAGPSEEVRAPVEDTVREAPLPEAPSPVHEVTAAPTSPPEAMAAPEVGPAIAAVPVAASKRGRVRRAPRPKEKEVPAPTAKTVPPLIEPPTVSAPAPTPSPAPSTRGRARRGLVTRVEEDVAKLEGRVVHAVRPGGKVRSARCPKCGKAVTPGARSCPSCGGPMST